MSQFEASSSIRVSKITQATPFEQRVTGTIRETSLDRESKSWLGSASKAKVAGYEKQLIDLGLESR